jgi:hypothetical protein
MTGATSEAGTGNSIDIRWLTTVLVGVNLKYYKEN